jgi:DNA-binding response OmpR family regulator
LLVEDEPSNAELVHEMLIVDGHSAFTLTDAWCLRDALDKLAQLSFDAVLLDLGLPDGDGVAALLAVQSAAPGTPVVCLSGHDDVELVRAVLAEGAHAYLRKNDLSTVALERTLYAAIGRPRKNESTLE